AARSLSRTSVIAFFSAESPPPPVSVDLLHPTESRPRHRIHTSDFMTCPVAVYLPPNAQAQQPGPPRATWTRQNRIGGPGQVPGLFRKKNEPNQRLKLRRLTPAPAP